MRRPLAGCAALALALGGCGVREPGEEAAPAADGNDPNVVVVMTDDQDVASLAVMPTVERELVGRGVEFTNSYVGLSECCPSRVTFLTGQHAHNHGVETSKPPEGGYPALDSSNTLAVWLERAGYRTGKVGRYVNYYGNTRAGTDPEEVPPGWDEWHVPVEHTEFQVYDYTLNHNGELADYGSEPSDYVTDVLSAKAQDFVESSAASEQPFFLWVTPAIPHAEGLDDVEAPPRNPRPAPRDEGAFADARVPRPPSFGEPDVSDKPPVIREISNLGGGGVSAAELAGSYRGRLESLQAVDRMVGQIMRSLRRTGELEDTYVVFTSDNGYSLGEHGWVGKRLVYEESTRVPLVVRGPGIPPGSKRDELVQNIDLAPTITAIAGAEPGLEPDGVPIFGPAAEPLDPRRDLLISYPQRSYAFDAVRTSDGLVYAEYEDSSTELYDLTRDPHQLENLSGRPAYAERERDARLRLHELKRCEGTSCG